MGDTTEISWADHTFNPWIGCAKMSPACEHCYAETLMDTRYKKVKWGPSGTRVKTSVANWNKPIQWDRKAEKDGVRRRVFCASLADAFEDRSELTEWRDVLFATIQATQHLDWLLLTKRPQNIARMASEALGWDVAKHGMPPHAWIGTSVENQRYADERIPHLLRVPAAVRFLSCEPLLGPVNLTRYIPCERTSENLYHGFVTPLRGWYSDREQGRGSGSLGPAIDWVITGGESGQHARPSHPDWFRALRDQCQAAGVAFHHKQWGEWHPIHGTGRPHRDEDDERTPFAWVDPTTGAVRQSGCEPDALMLRVGKSAAGRLLDGREWLEFPEVPA